MIEDQLVNAMGHAYPPVVGFAIAVVVLGVVALIVRWRP